MAQQQIRFCLLLEQTAAMLGRWADIRGSIVEPILRSIAGQGRCELALVLFGAAGFSPAVVQASQWTQDVSQLRQWLDDVELSGGCNQPVAFGEALLEAAALLELPTALALAPGAPPVQGHCLVCMVSDPASTAVPWPYASAYGKWAHLPGLITPMELVHALCTRRITLGLATRLRPQQHLSTPLVLHWLHTLVQPQVQPSTPEQFVKEHQAEWRALGTRMARTAGGSVAVFPRWDQGLQAVLQYNVGQEVPQQHAGRAIGASPATLDADTPSPGQFDLSTADTPGSAQPQNRGLTPQPGGIPPSPPNQRMLGTPPPAAAAAAVAAAAAAQYGMALQEATAAFPVATAAGPALAAPAPVTPVAATAGFMELMSMPSSLVAASQQQQQLQQQQAAPVQPQPPFQDALWRQQQQQQQQQQALQPLQYLPNNLAVAWRGQLQLSDRIRGTAPAVIGKAELIGRVDQMKAFPRSSLPPVLLVNKFVSAKLQSAELVSKNPLQMHLRVTEWNKEGETALLRIGTRGAAGKLDLLNGYEAALLVYLKSENPGAPPKLSMRLALYMPDSPVELLQ